MIPRNFLRVKYHRLHQILEHLPKYWNFIPLSILTLIVMALTFLSKYQGVEQFPNEKLLGYLILMNIHYKVQ